MLELEHLLLLLLRHPRGELVLDTDAAPTVAEANRVHGVGLPPVTGPWLAQACRTAMGPERAAAWTGQATSFAHLVPGVGAFDLAVSGPIDAPSLRARHQSDRTTARLRAVADVGEGDHINEALRATLALAVQAGASDIHLGDGDPPMARIKGELRSMVCPASEQPVVALVDGLLSKTGRRILADGNAVDFAFSVEGVGRFRGNVYRALRGFNLAIRTLPEDIPSLRDLRLPRTLTELTEHKDGLVLFSGPTGAGKSATMAALVAHINRTRPVHIITLEDPIEFVHKRDKAIVRQREIGVHCESFADGLRDALREDPDVILVGEMRDLDTIALAITAAETGHLVLSTLHSNRAHLAVDRMVDVFPEGRQSQIRLQLADVLRAVVTQRLLPMATGSERIAALEVLRVNHAVANHIREKRAHQIPSIMQTHRDAGMWMLERHLASMIRKGQITEEIGQAHAGDLELLDGYLKG